MNKVEKSNTVKAYFWKVRLALFGMVLACALGLCGCESEEQSLEEMLAEKQALEAVQNAEASCYGSSDASNCVDELVEIQTLWVHICGYVQTPGIYELPVDSRIYDCLMAAGGFAKGADETALNLADYLQDGSQIYVPGLPIDASGNTGVGVDGQRSVNDTERLININTATQEQLETLPGIGENRAREIIAYRESQGPFESIEDIQKISGIKTAIYTKIKDLITVGK